MVQFSGWSGGETMSGMVERVARAAYLEYSGSDPESEYAWWYGKDEGQPYDWRKEADRTSVEAEGFLRCARAAIAAMREPTEAMIEAGRVRGLDDGGVEGRWRAMIDAELAD
jgi:hypothetical protein